MSKPSLTKQIAEVLGTDSKKEQLERIQKLIQTAQSPSATVTVMLDRGQVKLSVLSVAQLSPEDVKFILQKGIDEVTTQVVKAELESGEVTQEMRDELEKRAKEEGSTAVIVGEEQP